MNPAEANSWLGKMSALNVDAAKASRPLGAAPHKPLLLLIVCDLAEEGALTGGRLLRDGALAFRFATFWRVVADRRRTKPDLRLPFYHMRSDGFWRPLNLEGKTAEIREQAVVAEMEESFLRCLYDAEFRLLARRTLIANNFSHANERAELYALCGIPVPPADVVTADATRFLPSDRDENKRDAKFSMRVLPAYDFTCALTRYRMLAIDGSTALDAAHIHQFKQGGLCHPANGMALSKSAHWLFDRGYWSLTDDFRVLVRAERFDESGDAGHLLKPRAGSVIHLPSDRAFWPDRECLAWHRQRHSFAA